MKKGNISILRAVLGILLVISGIFHFYNYFTGTYAAVSEYMNGVVLFLGIIQLFFGIIALFWDKIKIFRGKEKRMTIILSIILMVAILVFAAFFTFSIEDDTEKFYGTWKLESPALWGNITLTFYSDGTYEEIERYSDYNVTFEGIWKLQTNGFRTENRGIIGIFANKTFRYYFLDGNTRLMLIDEDAWGNEITINLLKQ